MRILNKHGVYGVFQDIMQCYGEYKIISLNYRTGHIHGKQYGASSFLQEAEYLDLSRWTVFSPSCKNV